jgi:hypothetical protein
MPVHAVQGVGFILIHRDHEFILFQSVYRTWYCVFEDSNVQARLSWLGPKALGITQIFRTIEAQFQQGKAIGDWSLDIGY